MFTTPSSSSSDSPLNELLEDLPSQAVADLHYVWLRGGGGGGVVRHINSSSGRVFICSIFLSALVFSLFLCLPLKLTNFTETPGEHI